MASDRATNHALRKMIEDLKVIQRDCDPSAVDSRGTADDGEKLDGFEAAKRELTFLLLDLKKDIERRNEIVQNHGRQEQTIRMKSENEKKLADAKKTWNDMKRALHAQTQKKRKRLPESVLKDRKDMIDLFEQSINDLVAMHNNVRPRGRDQERSIARNLVETRKTQRDEDEKQGKAPIEMKEMSEGTQAFMQEKEKHDAKMDSKLDAIYHGLQDLNQIAVAMNEELKVQDHIIVDVDKQLNVLDAKFKTANQRMEKLLEETGGATRWCALLICFIILLALIAYIFQIISPSSLL